MQEPGTSIRLDKWLWHARFWKSRSLAAQVCRARKVRIDGQLVARASATVSAGNVLTFAKGEKVWVVRVLAIGTRRGPAREAQSLYQDLSPAAAPGNRKQDAATAGPVRETGSGRPTKKQRRDTDRLRNRD